jgi:arginyl-tRNA synthetase
MKEIIRKAILKVVDTNWKDCDLKIEDIEINQAPDKFGDYSSNVAMKLAGIVRKSPMEIAEKISKELEFKKPPQSPFKKGGGYKEKDISKNSETLYQIEKTEVAQPGFINFYFGQKAYQETLEKIQKQAEKFGFSDLGQGKKVMVEFGQPNTHKAITVGHLKSAVSGLSVVKLFEALGYEVIKANYFGDVGMHVAKSTWGMKQAELPKDFEEWSNDQKMRLVNEVYVKASLAFKDDPEVEKEIRQVNKDIYKKQDNENWQWYQKIRDWSIEHQNSVFNKLGIDYDRQYPESEIYQEALEIVERNKGKIFEESQGAVIYNGEKDGLNNWVLLTKEGVPTYSAKDLALAHKKFDEYDLDLAVVTTSVEQSDYFKAIIKILGKIDNKFEGKYKHIPFGWLLMGGKKTSSRMGKIVKCVDIIEEARELAKEKIAVDKDYSLEQKQEIINKVSLAGLKFLILSHEFHKNINYDPDEFIKLNGFSGPFILYSYVRIKSIIEKNGQDFSWEDLDFDKIEFNKKEERELASALVVYPDVVLRAGQEISPHIICTHLYEIAQKFNSFYENCSIQKAESEEQKKSRLALAVGTGQVLKNGLGLLGIDTLEKM